MAVINSGRMLQVIVNLSIEGARKNAAYISGREVQNSQNNKT
jgi:hypothetical protein